MHACFISRHVFQRLLIEYLLCLYKGPLWRQGHCHSHLSLPIYFWHSLVFCLFFLGGGNWLFRAAPLVYESSWARGQTGATAHWPIPQPQQRQIQVVSMTYTIAHGNTRSLTHWERPGIEPASSWILVGLITTEPPWEPFFLIVIIFAFWPLIHFYPTEHPFPPCYSKLTMTTHVAKFNSCSILSLHLTKPLQYSQSLLRKHFFHLTFAIIYTSISKNRIVLFL